MGDRPMPKQARKTGVSEPRQDRALLSGVRIPDASRERPWRKRDRDQYLEMLSRRHSERTGLPLARAREYIKAVSVSARKPAD
jgi:hypothetical protein